MPNDHNQTMLKDTQYAQSTHNVITSNAAAMLAIRLASRYLMPTITSNTPEHAEASSSVASSSSSQTSSPVYTLSMDDNLEAQKRMQRNVARYEGRKKLSQLEASTKIWLKNILNSTQLSSRFDKVTLVKDNDGHLENSQWYLPLPVIYAIVVSALIDKNEQVWPVPPGSTPEKERYRRLVNFDQINNLLAAGSNVCNTGIRHAWLMSLDGYEGKRLPLNASDLLMRGLFDFMVHEVLLKQLNIQLPEGRDPVGEERQVFYKYFQPLFLPWVCGNMPKEIYDGIIKAGGPDSAKQFIIQCFLAEGSLPDKKMMKKINGYCSMKGLKSMPCDFIPILASLKDFIDRHTLATNSGSIRATGLVALADETLAWLKSPQFTPSALEDDAEVTDPFSRIYLVIKLHDALYHYKSYRNLLGVSDIPEERKASWMDALETMQQCFDSPNPSLANLLQNMELLHTRLRAFEQGFTFWRNNAYHDFISNYTAQWFAAKGKRGLTIRANLFALLSELFFQENTQELNAIPVIRLHDELLLEWISRLKEDGILEITPYQINRTLLHALCYDADTWTPLFRYCLTQVLLFIRNRCNQGQNSAGEAISQDSWPESLLIQIEHRTAPDLTPEPVSVLFTPGNITSASSTEIAGYLAAATNMSQTIIRKIVQDPRFAPNALCNKEGTPFLYAIGFGNINLAAALIEKGLNYMDTSQYDGVHPLYCAFKYQQTAFILWFLQTITKDERTQILLNSFGTKDSPIRRAAKYCPDILLQLLDWLPVEFKIRALLEYDNPQDSPLILLAIKSPQTLIQVINWLPKGTKVKLLMANTGNEYNLIRVVSIKCPEILLQLIEVLPDKEKVEALTTLSYLNTNILRTLATTAPGTVIQLIKLLPGDEQVNALTKTDSHNKNLFDQLAHRPELLMELLKLLPGQEKIKVITKKNDFKENILHKMAVFHPHLLKDLLYYLPIDVRAQVLMMTADGSPSILYPLLTHPPEFLEQVLDSLADSAKTEVLQSKDDNGRNIIHYAQRYSMHLNIMQTILQRTSECQTHQPDTPPPTSSPDARTASAASNIRDSVFRGSHTLFRENSDGNQNSPVLEDEPATPSSSSPI